MSGDAVWNINTEDLGIWIDPIGEFLKRNSLPETFFYIFLVLFKDSTNNYIYGDSITEMSVAGDRVMVSKGLHVVTVLIGVYNKSNGQPIVGVVNQPFAEYDQDSERCVRRFVF